MERGLLELQVGQETPGSVLHALANGYSMWGEWLAALTAAAYWQAVVPWSDLQWLASRTAYLLRTLSP